MKVLISLLMICAFLNVHGQIDTITWTPLSSLPDPTQRVISGYFLIDSDFFVAGGQAGGSGTLNTVWKYHIPTDSWIQMQNLPFGASASGGSFVLNGMGYFLTARDSISNFNCDTLFWMYDPSNDSWTKKANFPDKPRQNSSYFVYGGMGYVCSTLDCISDDNHLWQYDPILDKWTQMLTIPGVVASGRAVATAIPDAAYFIGGYTISGGSINDLWRYNINNNSWDSIGQMPGIAREFAIMWGFDSILIGGGGTNFGTLFNDFYRYDISSDIWTSVVFQNSFDSTGGGAPFIYNKRGYYFGGYSTINPNITFNNNMWSFDASRFFPDTTTGIVQVKNQTTFSVYPNPASHKSGFYISTSESGSILFYDALGRTLEERKLVHGLNQIKLPTDDEVIFYRAALQYGAIENGKIVFVR